jgi:hypothetical protein
MGERINQVRSVHKIRRQSSDGGYRICMVVISGRPWYTIARSAGSELSITASLSTLYRSLLKLTILLVMDPHPPAENSSCLGSLPPSIGSPRNFHPAPLLAPPRAHPYRPIPFLLTDVPHPD